MIIRRDKKNILQNFTTAQAALAKQIMDVDIPVLISTCNSWVSTYSKNEFLGLNHKKMEQRAGMDVLHSVNPMLFRSKFKVINVLSL